MATECARTSVPDDGSRALMFLASLTSEELVSSFSPVSVQWFHPFDVRPHVRPAC